MGDAGLIDPAALEKELIQKWRDAAQLDQSSDKTADAPQARVRAILSNLVLVISQAQVFPPGRLDDFVTDICIGFPSRIFVVELGLDDKTPVAASVASRCFLARSGSHVCSEEIRFAVRPAGIPSAANLLESLFVADAPRILALPGDAIASLPAKDEVSAGRPDSAFVRLFRVVRQVCDRILFDSGHFVRLDHSMRVMRSGDGEGKIFQDLSWTRSERWRQLVAELFDAPGVIAVLPHLQRIELKLRPREAGGKLFLAGDSLLVAGWLLQALDWTPTAFSKKGTEPVLDCTVPGETPSPREVRLSLVDPSPVPCESLLSIKCIFEQGKTGGEVSVTRDMKSARAAVSAALSRFEAKGAPAVADRFVPFRAVLAEDIFVDTVTAADSSLFERSLQTAEKIARLWGDG
jgi:hypothetical protein